MKTTVVLFLSLLLSLNAFGFEEYLDDIPRPGGVEELSRIIDQAIQESRERIRRQKERRQKAFADGFYPGHTIELITDGKTLLEKRLELIRSAQDSIYLSTFIFDKDEAGREIGNALCDAAKRGVDVRLLVDSFGAKPFYNKYAKAMRKDCGAGILRFNPPRWGLSKVVYVIHEKLIIADGKRLLMGGNGIQNAYHDLPGAHKYFHDNDAYIEGPVACWFHKKFIESYEESRFWDSPKDIRGRAIRSRRRDEYLFGSKVYRPCEETPIESGMANINPNYANPLFQEEKPIFDTYLNAFVSSSKHIKLYAPYFVPHDGYVAALLWAKRNGIEVDIITNSIESNDEGTAVLSAMVYRVGKLVKNGIRIHLWQGPKTLHKKNGIYDSKWAHIGSDNLDSRGHLYSSESVSFVEEPNFVKEMEDNFDEDMKNTVPLNKERMAEILKKTGRVKNWVIRKWLWKYF